MTKPIVPGATTMIEDLQVLNHQCGLYITNANENYTKYYDRGRAEACSFTLGDLVMLSSKNINSTRPSQKLDWKYTGPYEVLESVGTHTYRINLPLLAKIHDMINIT